MLRQQKAWILLVAFMLWCMQGVLLLASHSASKSCCASVSCCAGNSCPMRSRPAEPAMPKDCPMAGGAMSSKRPVQRTMKCNCSVSSNESSANPPTHSDFRFELARFTYTPKAPISHRYSIRVISTPLIGFVFSLDHPPEFLS